MADDTRPTRRVQFTAGLDLCAALATLGIESLDVSPERTIAIDGRTILDLVVVEGHLADARTVEVALLDQPPAASEPPQARLETVIDRLETTAATERGGADGSGASPS